MDKASPPALPPRITTRTSAIGSAPSSPGGTPKPLLKEVKNLASFLP